MRKVDIAKEISSNLNIKEDLASRVINEIIRELGKHIDRGRTISIRGFGTFSVKNYSIKNKSSLLKNVSESSSDKYVFYRPRFKAGNRLRLGIKEKSFK